MVETAGAPNLTQLLDIETHNPQETRDFGASFSKRLVGGDIVCFRGDLGAGKTTCIQGICAGLNVAQPVTSPTFTLINEYDGSLPVYHFDFYRIRDESEVIELGLSEYFYSARVCLVEWPERIKSLLPAKRYEIHMLWNFALNHNTRQLKVFAG
jgi:tRNA threonylcarbamoyladenosine biosynthesis protein TsaE